MQEALLQVPECALEYRITWLPDLEELLRPNRHELPGVGMGGYTGEPFNLMDGLV